VGHVIILFNKTGLCRGLHAKKIVLTKRKYSLEYFTIIWSLHDLNLPLLKTRDAWSNGSMSNFYLFGATAPQWARASSFTRIVDHTQRRTTVSRTPLAERLAPRRDHYLTTHNSTSKYEYKFTRNTLFPCLSCYRYSTLDFTVFIDLILFVGLIWNGLTKGLATVW
jgi:hypothetical protein